MDSVKWVLLNAHCWCCYCDILVCSLITPYFFFPTISGFPVGLFRELGIPTSSQVFIGIVSCMFMGISLVALFENRSSCIPRTIAQAIIPLIFLVIPVATAISSIYFEFYIQVVNNSCVIFLSFHGFASTITIVLVHHPYRKFMIKIVTFDRSTEKHASTGASYVTKDVRATMRRLSNRVLPVLHLG
ncbi:hypothetical protein L3Y34_008051 [Caenorhabditis briggsae]|uniref:Uncharacterized protein n=1 Tax=Caenorhabditis briggsae TaxID=6238 RepID=A0AAE9D0Y8_CAEBR|nr:hypothetical protein L3Y34_008051 [Caenorhabditis briggsae]